MTYEEIKKANEQIKTTDIKGKDYAEVNQRIKVFRMLHPDGAIEPKIVSLENGMCVMSAVVKNADGEILGVGHAYEKEDSSFINKTSYIENCETSAVGRALGMLGIGIDTSMRSAEETQNAQLQEAGMKTISKTKVAALKGTLKDNGIDEAKVVEAYKVSDLGQLTEKQHSAIINNLDKVKKNCPIEPEG